MSTCSTTVPVVFVGMAIDAPLAALKTSLFRTTAGLAPVRACGWQEITLGKVLLRSIACGEVEQVQE